VLAALPIAPVSKTVGKLLENSKALFHLAPWQLLNYRLFLYTLGLG
jgi:hypothetical protein